jgi:hypothetical protein
VPNDRRALVREPLALLKLEPWSLEVGAATANGGAKVGGAPAISQLDSRIQRNREIGWLIRASGGAFSRNNTWAWEL